MFAQKHSICGIRIAMLLSLLLASQVARAADPGSRQSLNVNAFWKYQQGDFPGADAATFSDTAWQSVGLPHSFSMPYFMSQEFYVGYGWYRKHLALPDSVAGQRV